MIRINENYRKLQSSYLFSEIAKRVSAFQEANPDREVIKLGIGDVTRPLPEACIRAFHEGVDDLANGPSFKGYGPEQGYPFLREKIAAHDFQSRNADIDPSEIFVSDGSKCDTANIQELFATDIKIAIPDPVYPVYLDTNVMAGRTGIYKDGRYGGVVYLPSTAESDFLPDFPEEPVDLIYLCFPNNPTGATISREALGRWVDFARDNHALILFDAAYESFIRDDSLPHSIYEIEGPKRWLSNFAAFPKPPVSPGPAAPTRSSPKPAGPMTAKATPHNLNALWHRRHTTKFNGVSYPVQKAAAAVYTPEGQAQTTALIDYYLKNAALIRDRMATLGFDFIGGENSPYIWINTGKDAWAFFDTLLHKAGVVCTPGPGFGRCGEGYVRISAFNDFEKVELAMDRIREALL
jgi:LL-diaminopimelate aminotransferase